VRWLNSNWVLVAAYLLAALTCLVIALRDRTMARHRTAKWPAFWFAVSGLFVVLAIVRGDGVASTLSNAARAHAQAEGWYPRRHRVQALALQGLAAGWALAVVGALWRIPRRRRRYLPVAVAVLSLLSFLAVRAVSLHRVDALLRRTVHGVGLSSLTELGCVALVTVLAPATAAWPGRGTSALRRVRSHTRQCRMSRPVGGDRRGDDGGSGIGVPAGASPTVDCFGSPRALGRREWLNRP